MFWSYTFVRNTMKVNTMELLMSHLDYLGTEGDSKFILPNFSLGLWTNRYGSS